MKNRYIIFTAFLVILCSCGHNDDFTFVGGSSVYINSGDSTSFSFAVKPQAQTLQEIKIPIKITGLSSDIDREILVQVDNDRTIFAKNGDAISGGHYTIEKCILPKDSINSLVVVKLYRDNINPTLEALNQKDADMAIAFRIVASKDFDDNLGLDKMQYIITFNDKLSIPKNWSSIRTYFGAPSLVKYQFMIDILGISEFPTSGEDKYEPGEFMFFKDKLKTALVKYNKEHKDPLTDENKNIVSFG